MRREEFNAWFGTILNKHGKPYTPSNIYFYVNAIHHAETHQGIDMDKEFQKDEMASIHKLFTYTKKDEKANRPNPTKLPIDARLYGALSDLRSALNHYRNFCLSAGDVSIQESPDNNNDTETIAESDSNATFALEADLQDAIRENITQLESGLEAIDNGVERKVTSGFIDILAKDSQGCLVVIELKAGKARDAVIAQILGYMGDIAQEENQPVRGIIVASDFNQRLRSASKAIPNLDLNSYSYTFDFKKET